MVKKQLFRNTIALTPTAEAFYAVARATDAALQGSQSAMESRSWIVRRALSLLAKDAREAIERDIRDAAARADAQSVAGIEAAMKRRRIEIETQLRLAFDAMEEENEHFAEHVRPIAEEFLRGPDA